jgi:hypothetical protein
LPDDGYIFPAPGYKAVIKIVIDCSKTLATASGKEPSGKAILGVFLNKRAVCQGITVAGRVVNSLLAGGDIAILVSRYVEFAADVSFATLQPVIAGVVVVGIGKTFIDAGGKFRGRGILIAVT